MARTRSRSGPVEGGARRRPAGRTWAVALLLALGFLASGPHGITGAVFTAVTANSSNTLTAAAVFPRCYSDAVTADGPSSYWRLDETSGTSAADSVGSQTGTYRNGVTLGQAGAMSATSNKAASFDAADDDVQMGDVYDYAGTASFSVEFWMNRTSANDTLWRPVIAKEDPGADFSSRQGWAMWLAPNTNTISMERWSGTTSSGIGTLTPIQAGRWYHIVATYDGSTIRLYVNGTLDRSAATSLALNDHVVPLRFGSFGTIGDPSWFSRYAGKLDDVSIYSSALSATQIRTHYNAGRCYKDEVLADSPAGYWRLGEPSGTATAFDAAGNSPGAYRGNPTLAQPGGLDGDANTSVSFDGLDDDVRINDNATQRPTQLSVEAWFKPASGNSRSGAVFKSSDFSWSDGWGMYYRNNGTINFFINNSTTGAVSVPVTFNAWVHIVATYDGATIKLYKNGLLAASLAYSTPINSSTQPLRIGVVQGNGGATFNWIGGIDEVAVYPSALSQTRVQAHYLRGRSYQNTVVDSAPVSSWRLGEASGTSAADSIGSNTGTYAGSPTLGQAGALAGDGDTSAGFDSATQNISVPDSGSLRPAQISVEAWVKPDSASINDFDSPVMKTSNDNWTDGYGLFYRSSGSTISFFVNSWGGAPAAAIALDRWTHVVGTYDGTTISLYLNGALAASTPYSTPIAHTGNALYIGSGTTGSGSTGPPGYFWGGSIDDVSVYSKALTATEIQVHYDSGRE